MTESPDTSRTTEDKLLTINEAAELAGVPPTTVRRWIRAGKVKGWIPADEVSDVRRTTERWLVDQSDLSAYARHVSVPPSLPERLKQWFEARRFAVSEIAHNLKNLPPISWIRRLVQTLLGLIVIIYVAIMIVVFLSGRCLGGLCVPDIVDLADLFGPVLRASGQRSDFQPVPMDAVLVIDDLGYMGSRELPLTLYDITDADELARTASRAGFGPIIVSVDDQEKMSAIRRVLGIPTNFLPAARNLVFLDVGELKIDVPTFMAWGQTAILTATLSLDERLLSPVDPSSLVFYSVWCEII